MKAPGMAMRSPRKPCNCHRCRVFRHETVEPLTRPTSPLAALVMRVKARSK